MTAKLNNTWTFTDTADITPASNSGFKEMAGDVVNSIVVHLINGSGNLTLLCLETATS